MDVTLTQHPVGQGGMMSGLLTIPGGRFHWVYDCGSNQTDALKREIARVAARGPIDCLFLSHLDSDHVNGIDRLLGQTTVTEVVLPYLNDVDRLIAAAHDATAGALTGGFLTFLGDIAGWLGARGVERVTFIGPRSDDDGEDAPRPEFGPGGEGGGEGPIRAKWQGGRQAGVEPVRSGEDSRGAAVQHLTTDANLVLVSASSVLDWLLIPYAHRPSDKRLIAFRRAMFRKFGPRYPSRLSRLMGDKTLREAVKDCYDLIWSDHNLVSMALYAGPQISSVWNGSCTSAPLDSWYHHHMGEAVGWLTTGDMHLNVGVRRRAMLDHYRRLLDQVNVFGLPHHGSHQNFHPSLLGEMHNMTQSVAASGPNGYGHPHAEVIDSVHAAGRQFVQVSHAGRAALQWRHSA